MYQLLNENGNAINGVKLIELEHYTLIAELLTDGTINNYVICNKCETDGRDYGDLIAWRELSSMTYYSKDNLDWAIHDLYKREYKFNQEWK